MLLENTRRAVLHEPEYLSKRGQRIPPVTWLSSATLAVWDSCFNVSSSTRSLRHSDAGSPPPVGDAAPDPVPAPVCHKKKREQDSRCQDELDINKPTPCMFNQHE